MTPAVLGFVGLGNMGRPMAATDRRRRLRRWCASTPPAPPSGCRPAPRRRRRRRRGGASRHRAPQRARRHGDARGRARASPRAADSPGHDGRSTSRPSVPRRPTRPRRCSAPAGITYVDGPVSGGVAGARAGTISLMFAGPDATCSRRTARSSTPSPATSSTSAPTPGQGQAMKLLNNFLSATALAATSEALAFGRGARPRPGDDARRRSTSRPGATRPPSTSSRTA